MISSTDGHNTISTTEEDNFLASSQSPSLGQRVINAMANDMLWQNTKLVASGYAAVWAEDNTRESLFDAMMRREVYATTGSGFRFGFLEVGITQQTRPTT